MNEHMRRVGAGKKDRQLEERRKGENYEGFNVSLKGVS